jgi:hypothetical protein
MMELELYRHAFWDECTDCIKAIAAWLDILAAFCLCLMMQYLSKFL